jgi:NitT/TauT family transport system substrate-binding protein
MNSICDRWKITWLMALLMLLSACAQPSPSSSTSGTSGTSGPEKDKVILAVGGKTGAAYLPLTLAEQKGFFKAEGLTVEIQDLQGGAKALQALVGGSADVVVGYYDHTIQMQAINKELTAVALISRYPGLVLGVRSDLAEKVKQISDLKGLKVGVTAPGSSTHFFINYLLAREGIKPTDVSAVGIGASQAAVAAIEQKQVDALVNLDPMITVLETRGLIKILADTRTGDGARAIYDGEYPGAVLYASRDFIQSHPITTQRLVNAIARALRSMQGQSLAEIAQSLPESYFAGNQELYLKGLSNSLGIFSPDGRFPASAPQKVLEVLAMFDEKVGRAKIDLSKTYTNRFIDQSPP